MQPSITANRVVQWSAVFIALLAALVLSSCDRRKQARPRPTPVVTTVTVQLQQVELTTELPGRTSAYLVAEIRPR